MKKDNYNFEESLGNYTWLFENKETKEVLVESGLDIDAAIRKLESKYSDFNIENYNIIGNLKDALSKLSED